MVLVIVVDCGKVVAIVVVQLVVCVVNVGLLGSGGYEFGGCWQWWCCSGGFEFVGLLLKDRLYIYIYIYIWDNYT